MSDRRSWFKRIFKLDYDEKFDGALELIQLQEYELDRTATLAERTDARVDGLQEAVKVTVKRVDDIESKIDAIRDFDFGGRRMLAQFDVESALAGDTAIRVQLDNVNHEARLRYGSVDVVDTIDAVWFISKTGVPIDNDFGDVLHPNAQRRDVIEFLKITSDLQGNVPLPGDGSADIADLDAKLNQEIVDREQGDKAVADALAQEVQDRTTGDEVLQDQIDALPAPTPPYDDTGVKADLAQEVTDREAGDTALDAKITKEVTDRTDADAVLDGKITKEVADRTAADKVIDDKVVKEVADRIAGDKALSDRINALNVDAGGPSFGGGGIFPASIQLGDYAWKRTNTPDPGQSGYYPQGSYLVETATHHTFAIENYDGVDNTNGFNKMKEVFDEGTPVYLSMATDLGSCWWKVTGYDATGTDQIKWTLDKNSISGDDALMKDDAQAWDNDGTKVNTYTVFIDLQAELDKKLNKAGDDLTGDITLKPTSSKRWIGLKNFPPKLPDGTNDTSESFGTRIDIDVLNTWKSRFKVTNRLGDIFMISGGGGPAVHVGPVNTKSDANDPDNELKRVPLILSPGEPEADDEAASKQYVDELGERLTADADLDWWGYGDYTFKRASDSAGTGFLQCKAPGGAPKAKDITQIWVNKTNKDGDTLDMSTSFYAGNVLKLVKNSNAAYYRILDERVGNTNNIELDIQWFRGMDTTVLYVNDVITVEEGTSRLSDYAHLNSANQFQATNHFNAATYFERTSSGSGYTDWKIKGHRGDLDQGKDLLSVYRNPVVADEQDAVNYYGKTDGNQNIVTREAVREAIAEGISNLDVELPKFHFFRDRLDVTCIADPARMPLLPPENYFIPKSTESSKTWNTWPGNVSWIDLHLGDLVDEGLATGMGNFIIRTVGGDIKLAGMIMGYAGRVSVEGKHFERLRVGKWTAAGNQWLDHEAYRIELSGTHWEKK